MVKGKKVNVIVDSPFVPAPQQQLGKRGAPGAAAALGKQSKKAKTAAAAAAGIGPQSAHSIRQAQQQLLVDTVRLADQQARNAARFADHMEGGIYR